MKPYKLITGNNENIENFEDKVSSLLEEGYELANRLTTKVVKSSDGKEKVLFFQPMIFDELFDDIYDEEEEEEEE